MLKNKKLKAVGATAIIELIANEETSHGGIITNINSHPLDSVIGKVIDMGPFAYVNEKGEYNPRCKLGDVVVFKKNCGAPWQDPDTSLYYRVMYDDDVIALLIEK